MMNFWEKIQNPSRFLGREVHAARKDLSSVKAQAVLLFPDHYDLGMSHLGYKIIYHALNQAPDLLCERAFCPEPDLEAAMRREGQGLKSLETGRELRAFDLVGLTLPHEMAATNLLTMLDLAGLALLAQDRAEADPIVLAGGPAVFNPEPLAEFVDAFFLGDGEEAAPEILRRVGEMRRAGAGRTLILREIEKIQGVYVPAHFRPVLQAGRLVRMERLFPGPEKVVKATIPDLDQVFAPQAPIIPFGRPVHDRLSVELARGCTRGCRFCQAGMIYRPVRERGLVKVSGLILESLARTGYEELGLLALSAGDYTCLLPLLKALMPRLGPERVAVSLPSLRADSFPEEAAGLIKQVRATGLTIAAEAGSERLRAGLNKNLTDGQILAAARQAARLGWRVLKLYFMIGLPTETEEDLAALAKLVRRIAAEAPGVRLNVSVGVFVPKPHTPFQWTGQLSAEEAYPALDWLKDSLRRLGPVNLKWNSPLVAQLEGVLCRGDRSLGRVIRRAWDKGARFEAWSDFFRWPPWAEALSEEGLKLEDLLGPRPLDEALPWDHLAVVDREFLVAEWARALQGQPTPDCREGDCQGCGVCDLEMLRPRLAEADKVVTIPSQPSGVSPRWLVLTYHKLGPARLLGHLELASLLHRALRRAGVGLGYSQGFHPQPRLSFPEALPLGVESLEEWAEVELADSRPLDQLQRLINAELTEGLKVTSLMERPGKLRPKASRYLVRLLGPERFEPVAVKNFLAQEEAPHVRVRGGKVQRLDLRRPVEEIKVVSPIEAEIQISAPTSSGPTARPEEVVKHLLGAPEAPLSLLKLKSLIERR